MEKRLLIEMPPVAILLGSDRLIYFEKEVKDQGLTYHEAQILHRLLGLVLEDKTLDMQK